MCLNHRSEQKAKLQTFPLNRRAPVECLWETNDLSSTVLIEVSHLEMPLHVPDGLADNTLAVLEYDRALAEISVAAFQPHGNQYRCLEILGANGKATVQPYAPVRLMLDLKEAAGPYKAGPQMLEPALPLGPTYAPDFREMAHIIRDGAKPSYSPEHDLIAQRALLEACGIT